MWVVLVTPLLIIRQGEQYTVIQLNPVILKDVLQTVSSIQLDICLYVRS